MISGMKIDTRCFWVIFKHQTKLQRTLNQKSNPSCNATSHRGKDQKSMTFSSLATNLPTNGLYNELQIVQPAFQLVLLRCTNECHFAFACAFVVYYAILKPCLLYFQRHDQKADPDQQIHYQLYNLSHAVCCRLCIFVACPMTRQ